MPIIGLSNGIAPSGIGLGEDLTGQTVKISVKDANGLWTLWENGVATPHVAPVGQGIELHVLATGTSTTSGSHTMAVSVRTNLAAPYNKMCKKWTALNGGTNTIDFDWNLGNMPNSNVAIQSAIFWMSPNATITDYPPEAEW